MRNRIALYLLATALAASAQTLIPGWTLNTSLPEESSTSVVSHGSSILVFASSSGYTGTVNASGIVTEWRPIAKPPAPYASGSESYVVVGDWVIFASYPNSYVADILSDGTISAWRPAPGVNPRLNVDGNTVVSDGTHIWSIGGCCLGTLEPRLSNVDVATFSSGVLSSWRPLNDFPVAIQNAALTLVGGHLYVYGGLNNGGSLAIGRDVRRAAVGPNGDLGPWDFVGFLQEPRPNGERIEYQGTVHVIAGGVHSFATNTVETVLATNLGVGPVQYSAPLPVANRHNFGTAVVRNLGFVIGGCASAFCATKSREVYTAVLGPEDPATAVERLRESVRQALSLGWIDNQGIAASLLSKIEGNPERAN